MIIDLKELNVIKDKLSKSLDNYNRVFLNYYNELMGLSDYWKDGNSFPFFSACEEAKKNGKKNYHFFKRLVQLFNNICISYHDVGEKIEYDFDYYDKMIDSVDKVSNKLSMVIQKYSSLNYSSFREDLKGVFGSHIEKCRKIYTSLDTIKDKNKDMKYRIDEIEEKIGGELSKFNLIYIADEEYGGPVSNGDGIMMDIEEVDKVINKLSMYKKEEDLIIEEIDGYFNDVQYYYQTNNSNDLLEIMDVIIENMKKLDQIHFQNILKLEKYMNNYIDTVKKTKRVLEELGDLK